jgi:hypothetical protein
MAWKKFTTEVLKDRTQMIRIFTSFFSFYSLFLKSLGDNFFQNAQKKPIV